MAIPYLYIGKVAMAIVVEWVLLLPQVWRCPLYYLRGLLGAAFML